VIPFLEYAAFRVLAAIVTRLPYSVAGALGTTLGLAVLYLTRYRRAVTLDNLAHAFPEMSDDARLGITRGAYANYGRAIVEMLWAGGQRADTLKAKVHPRNPELVHEALSRGRGLILISAHFGSWELLLTGLKRNERIDAMIDSRRRRFDVQTVPMGPSVREVLKGLQEGKVVLILGDQSGPRESVFIPFFGRPSATHRGAAAFALRSGAPIIVTVLLRRDDGTYDAVFEPVDSAGLTGDREAQIVELTKRHTAVVERCIRMRPDHWLWMHKRWKHTPEYEQKQQVEQDAEEGV